MMLEQDDELLEEGFEDDDYDLENEEEEALLADDEEYRDVLVVNAKEKKDDEIDDVLELDATGSLDDFSEDGRKCEETTKKMKNSEHVRESFRKNSYSDDLKLDLRNKLEMLSKAKGETCVNSANILNRSSLTSKNGAAFQRIRCTILDSVKKPVSSSNSGASFKVRGKRPKDFPERNNYHPEWHQHRLLRKKQAFSSALKECETFSLPPNRKTSSNYHHPLKQNNSVVHSCHCCHCGNSSHLQGIAANFPENSHSQSNFSCLQNRFECSPSGKYCEDTEYLSQYQYVGTKQQNPASFQAAERHGLISNFLPTNSSNQVLRPSNLGHIDTGYKKPNAVSSMDFVRSSRLNQNFLRTQYSSLKAVPHCTTDFSFSPHQKAESFTSWELLPNTQEIYNMNTAAVKWPNKEFTDKMCTGQRILINPRFQSHMYSNQETIPPEKKLYNSFNKVTVTSSCTTTIGIHGKATSDDPFSYFSDVWQESKSHRLQSLSTTTEAATPVNFVKFGIETDKKERVTNEKSEDAKEAREIENYQKKLEEQKELRRKLILEKENRRKLAALEKLGLDNAKALSDTNIRSSHHYNKFEELPSLQVDVKSKENLIGSATHSTEQVTGESNRRIIVSSSNFVHSKDYTANLNIVPKKNFQYAMNSKRNDEQIHSPTECKSDQPDRSCSKNLGARKNAIISKLAKSIDKSRLNVIHIKNLGPDVNETHLRRICESVGTVQKIRVGKRNAVIVFNTRSAALSFQKKYRKNNQHTIK